MDALIYQQSFKRAMVVLNPFLRIIIVFNFAKSCIIADRHSMMCLRHFAIATRTDILHILEADPQLSSLSLSNKALQDVHVLPLYRALQCHDTLTKLMLPGNRIGTYMYQSDILL